MSGWVHVPNSSYLVSWGWQLGMDSMPVSFHLRPFSSDFRLLIRRSFFSTSCDWRHLLEQHLCRCEVLPRHRQVQWGQAKVVSGLEGHVFLLPQSGAKLSMIALSYQLVQQQQPQGRKRRSGTTARLQMTAFFLSIVLSNRGGRRKELQFRVVVVITTTHHCTWS